MNGGAKSLIAGTPRGLSSSLFAVPTARPAPGRWVRRPALRPWPLASGLGPLGALPAAPGVAREFTATVLGGWEMASRGDLVDTSKLLVSELSTNVVDLATGEGGSPAYLPGGRLAELWLRLMTDRAALRIEVWDNLPPSAGFPVLRNTGATEEHGRGLDLVQRLSRRWGWHPVPGNRAKCTWAVLDVSELPAAVAARG